MRLFTAFPDKLRFFGEHSVLKCIFSLQFTLKKSLSIVYLGIIAQSIAGTVFVIEIHVFLKNFHELFSAPTFIDFKIHVQFFLHPAVYGLIYRIIRRLPGSGHGSDYNCILDQLIVRHRGINAPLVSMKNNRLCLALQEIFNVLQTIDVLISIPFPCRHLISQNLLCKHIEVECHLKVQDPELKGCHIRYDYLSGTVYGLPCGKYQVRIFILLFTLSVVDLMLCLRLYTKESETLVNIVVATFAAVFKPDICSSPAIAMRPVIGMHSLYKSDQLLTLNITLGLITFLPLIVPRSADSHESAQFLYIIIP